jgi:cell division initiation protein
MEISGKILREVEFRDRLRGYDTDEVDEFLEKVAIGVDELHEEVAAANVRAERAEHQAEAIPPADDDSIRRTLVLAQRTADLAISEAREEAARLLEQARSQSDAVLGEARQAAQSMRSDAEREMQARVQQLGEEHDRLTRQIGTLTSLIEGERSRLSESLSALLGYVAESLSLDAGVAEAAQLPGLDPSSRRERSGYYEGGSYDQPVSGQGRPYGESGPSESERGAGLFESFVHDDDPLDLGLPDIEAEIGEDAAIAFGVASRELAPESAIPELDPDEELWTRWANSAESGEGSKDPSGEPFKFGRRPGDDPA